MIDVDLANDLTIEARGDEVAVILSIGPATVTAEVPDWAVPMIVRHLRDGVDEARDEYHELLDQLEDAANGS